MKRYGVIECDPLLLKDLETSVSGYYEMLIKLFEYICYLIL